MRSILFAAALVLGGLASAQSCGTLAVTGTGAPGTTLDIGLTGATANSLVLVFVGENTGSTPIRLGMGTTLTIGLARPFVPVPLGRTDGNGDLSRTFTVPTRIPQQFSLNGQAATLTITWRPFSLGGCTSNVVPFTIG
jgi:hypothetical protein